MWLGTEYVRDAACAGVSGPLNQAGHSTGRATQTGAYTSGAVAGTDFVLGTDTGASEMGLSIAYVRDAACAGESGPLNQAGHSTGGATQTGAGTSGAGAGADFVPGAATGASEMGLSSCIRADAPRCDGRGPLNGLGLSRRRGNQQDVGGLSETEDVQPG